MENPGKSPPRASGRRLNRKVSVGAGLWTIVGFLGLLLLPSQGFSPDLVGIALVMAAETGLGQVAWRAMTRRAERHLDRGVPMLWTRPQIWGVQDARMRRIEETIRACEPPMDADQDMALKAARARSEDLIPITLPPVLACGLSIAVAVLQATGRGTLQAGYTILAILGGVVWLLIGWRYVQDGWRARAFLKRYGGPAGH